MLKVINFNLSLLLCCANTASNVWLYIYIIFSSLPLHFSEVLSAIIPNVNLAGPQQEQKQAPQQGPQLSGQVCVWTRASLRTMPRASLVVKVILATSWGVHAAPWPSNAATLTLQHLYQRICTARFIPWHSHSHIHATQHLCSSIHATALMLQCWHYSIVLPLSRSSIDAAALTMPHLCCSMHTTAFTKAQKCLKRLGHYQKYWKNSGQCSSFINPHPPDCDLLYIYHTLAI